LKIGFVQFFPIFGKKEENLRKVEKLIQKEEADLLVLPELFNTGYIFADKEELKSLAEEIPKGETTKFLVQLSRQKNVSLVFGIAEKDGDKLYNSAVLLTPEGIKGIYRKLHLFDQEKLIFDAGDKEPEVFDDGKAKIGMMVCFDWLFPEVARVLVLKGAEIICHPSALVLPYAQEAMRIRSLENRVFTITCNRTGEENRGSRKLSFTGKSQITDPKGNILLKGSQDKDEVGIMEIDPLLARDKKFTDNNFIFDDRRPEFYKRLLTK
jgi:predicted amidohydrolase